MVTPADDSARALYLAMIGALGPGATGGTGTLELPPAPRSGLSVLVLGAGIGGLTAAYELSRRGFACTVLEAQDRPGGRNRTARNGDELVEIDPSGSPVVTHRCSFDDDLYFNLGPGRIPYHHRRVLKYCRDLGVALEPYVMETTANLVRLSTTVSARWHNRRVANDVRGQLSALLYRYLVQDEDGGEDLRELLRVFGDLSPGGEYSGSTRSGYELGPGNEFPTPAPPLDLPTLVASRFWPNFYQPIEYLWQATMFQPAGGMDMIVTAFTEEITRRFGPIIRLGAAVTTISLPDEGGVVVEYVHNGTTYRQTADHCVSSIPLPVLRGVALSNFSGDFIDATRAVGFAPTCKVGWQADRFWEDDQNAIYGGISWTDHAITQMWYPSNDLGAARGVLTGAYNFGANAEYLGDLKPARRLEEACTGAIELHPEFQDPAIVPPDKGVSIAWHKVPHQLGGWAGWDPADPDHMAAYRTLLQPQGGDRFYVLGDQASPLPGWQEGAMMSAHYVAGQILGAIPRTVPEVVEIPDSIALTQGRR